MTVDPLVNRSLAHFRIVRRIGAGGMGVVYRAVDEKLRRDVALKVVRETGGQDTGRRQRLLREARVAAAVTHPNIATIYEVGEADGVAYIAMELIDGQSLGSALAAGPMAVTDALFVAREVASAAAAAHDAGVVHRDLKPSNVMLASSGAIKVLDFGLAKRAEVAESADPNDIQTEEGRVMGTPGYMAPEQAEGRHVGAAADIFALGATIYEMLAGRPPFTAETAMKILIATSRDDHVPLDAIRPDTPAAIVDLVDDCLAKEPGDRPASAHELVARLDDALQALGGVDAALPITLMTTVPEADVLDVAATTKGIDAPPATPNPIAGGDVGEGTGGRVVRAGIVALVVVGLVAAAAVWSASRSSESAGAAAASVDAKAASGAEEPLAEVPGWPLPKTANKAAVAAYSRAIAAMRRGDFEGYPKALHRAVDAEPALAAAHLRLSCHYFVWQRFELARKHHKAATLHKDSLSERERAILSAYNLLVLRQPADRNAAADRLVAAVKRFPNDPELLYLYANTAKGAGRYPEAEAALEHALQADPGFAFVLGLRAHYDAYAGRFERAEKGLARCMEEAPTSFFCLLNLMWIASYNGRCADLEKWSRQTIAAHPERSMGHVELAIALVAQGKPMSGVRAAMEQGFLAGRKPEEVAARRKKSTADIWLSATAGQFDVAERKARELRKVYRTSRQRDEQARPVRWLVRILDETGRLDEAATLAADFLDKVDAWEEDPRAEDYALSKDAVPEFLRILRRAGRIDGDELRRRRDKWLAHWRAKKLQPKMQGFLWVYGYAIPVTTPAEATEALATLPDHQPLPPFAPIALPGLHVGRTMALAGRLDEAIVHLRQASRVCRILPSAFRATRVWRELGDALARAGKTGEACDAYAEVVRRWGKATPRSVTAEHARARSAALGCND